MRFLRVLVLPFVLGAGMALAQDAAKPAVVADNPDVVATVIVHDKKGALVNDLKQADFTVLADKKPQTIKAFEHAPTMPMTLGLLVDTSRVGDALLDEEREGASAYLAKYLTAGNKAFLVQFAAQVQLVEDTTDKLPTLARGLKSLTVTPPLPRSTTMPDNSGNGNDNVIHGGTALYDAIFLSSDEILAKAATRRVLIVLTDGVDRNSKESIDAAIEEAQRADTTIYVIYVKPDEKRDSAADPNNHKGLGQGGSNGNCNSRGNSGGGYPTGSGGG